MWKILGRRLLSRGFSLKGRSQVERIELYTRASLYWVCWFFLLLAALNVVTLANGTTAIVVSLLVVVVLGVVGSLTLRECMRLYPAYAPVPWRLLTLLAVLVLVTDLLTFALPEKAEFAGSLVVVPALAWGAGGLRDRRIQAGVVAASTLLPWLTTGSVGVAAYGLSVSIFLIFTVQSSLWLLELVYELERSRDTQAALAVAEERLRFSRDVHDVMGRQLSTIAVQAELAATLAERGDPRAARHILEVRESAHDALREARELARGYRPLDLLAETNGAVSLLESAGITATADLAGLPQAWHEPVARVVREAMTNVLRHSSATRVDIKYDDGEVVITNDGATATSRPRVEGGTGGTGLVGLAEQLAPSGAAITTENQGDEFVVRVRSLRRRGATGGGPVIRVLLADDENLIRSALAQMLDLEDDIEVVAEAANGADALVAARASTPDVAVLDLQMPDQDGITVAEELGRTLPGCGCVIVTSHGRPGYLKRALASGVKGFLPKTTSAATLAQVVRIVHAGGRHVDPELAAEAIAAGDSPLTPREADVLEAAAGGAPVEDIARRVHLTPGTVRNYLSSAVAKLGASNRHEAAVTARRMGWI